METYPRGIALIAVFLAALIVYTTITNAEKLSSEDGGNMLFAIVVPVMVICHCRKIYKTQSAS